jgi:Ca2+-binding RTX toxin-like protein
VDTTFGGGDGIVVVHPAVSSGAITLLITPNNDLVLTSLKQTTSTAQWFATKLKGGGFADIASGKLLIVSGSTGNDSTSVSATSSTLSVKVNGATQSFSKSAVSSIRVNGFGGDDTINVGNGVGNVLMNGDDGNDVLLGGNGNDTLIGGRGSDTLSGGSGNDTADYSAATSNLAIDQDNVADDGIAGENDNVRDDIETILGGSGNDRLIGGPSANLIRGGSGNDTIYGGAGNDSLDGGPGHDKLYGEVGNDTLFAKDGQTDTLDGGNGYDKAQRDNSTTIKDQVLNIESFI